jgi:hypothetical protein
MNQCLQVLPTAGGNVGILVLVTLMLAGGFVLLRSSRHNRNHLMVAALPLISLMTFAAPTTQNADDCPPETTTSLVPTTTVAPNTSATIAPDASTTVPPVTTTTVAEPTALKIVFLGHIRRDGDSNFEALRGGNLILCPEDIQDQALCTTFFVSTQPGEFETRTLINSDEWEVFALGCNIARLYNRDITFTEAFNQSVTPIGEETSPKSFSNRPLTNSDTVYVLTDDFGC